MLVTGASSGIGLAITKTLASEGYVVYATARAKQDIEMLSAITNVEGLELDVRYEHQIDKLVSKIADNGGLYAVINNAGVTDRGALMDMDTEDLMAHLEINLFGPHALIRRLFPLLLRSKGRIINISSLSGLVIPSFRGGYNLSKWGLVVYTEQLAQELKDVGVKAILIEPGIVTTGILDKLDRIYDQRINETELFKNALQESREMMKPRIKSRDKPPESVAKRVLEALTSQDPKQHYLVADKEEELLVAKYMVSRMLRIISGFSSKWTKQDVIDLISWEVE